MLHSAETVFCRGGHEAVSVLRYISQLLRIAYKKWVRMVLALEENDDADKKQNCYEFKYINLIHLLKSGLVDGIVQDILCVMLTWLKTNRICGDPK